MTGLEGFSDWVLALLPRVFLYPGGVWILGALLLLRAASGGVTAVKPHVLSDDLVKASLPALAVAWVALSLVPLSGASALSVPVDTLVLVTLVLVSLTLDAFHTGDHVPEDGLVSMAIAIGVMGASVRSQMASGTVSEWSISSTLAVLCVAAGLVALAPSVGRNLAAGVRWLAWAGLGFAPIFTGWTGSPVTGMYWTTFVYAVAVVIFAFAGKRIARNRFPWSVQGNAIVWGFALITLLAGVLGY